MSRVNPSKKRSGLVQMPQYGRFPVDYVTSRKCVVIGMWKYAIVGKAWCKKDSRPAVVDGLTKEPVPHDDAFSSIVVKPIGK